MPDSFHHPVLLELLLIKLIQVTQARLLGTDIRHHQVTVAPVGGYRDKVVLGR